MDNFIKKIFDREKMDEWVHCQFIKFSRGEFPERAMIRAKNSKGKYVITTTSEYAKDLIIYLSEKLGDKKVKVTGALISALDLEGKFEYTERKMAMGVRKYMIDREMSGREIIDMCSRVDKAFFGLSFSTEDTDLQIQTKSPKSAKGSGGVKKEDAKSKIDFIKIKTSDEGLVKNLIFEKEFENFNKIEIKHTFYINDIILPSGEKDFAKIRELAKRKGKVLREIDVDGKKIKKEAEFEA